ncbi:MAG: hypothetical protein ACRCWI_04305 [Brevinema sp.]
MRKFLLFFVILLLNRCSLSNISSSSLENYSQYKPISNILSFTSVLPDIIKVSSNFLYSFHAKDNNTLRLMIKDQNNRLILYTYNAKDNTIDRSDFSHLTDQTVHQLYYNTDIITSQEYITLITTSAANQTNFNLYELTDLTPKRIITSPILMDISLESQGIFEMANQIGVWYALNNTQLIVSEILNIFTPPLVCFDIQQSTIPTKDLKKIRHLFTANQLIHNSGIAYTFSANQQITTIHPTDIYFGTKNYQNALSTAIFSLIENQNRMWFTYNPSPNKMSIACVAVHPDKTIKTETIIKENIPGKEGVIARDQQNNLYMALLSPQNDLQIVRSSDNFQTLEVLGNISRQNNSITQLQLFIFNNIPILSYIDNQEFKMIKLNSSALQNSVLQVKIPPPFVPPPPLPTGVSISLQGESSSGYIQSYFWSIQPNDSAIITSPFTPNTEIIFNTMGTYDITLEISDGINTVKDSVTINI